MRETRVDLKHLLEDIRDSYPCPVEEAILTELIANSLDSGCSRIDIRVEPEQGRLTFVDNGEGMNRRDFEQYHDIASTGKVRGKGIGFAGVGAKLGLLVCREVLTETKRAKSCHCSKWWLETNFTARWEEMAPLRIVSREKGTGVRLHFRDGEARALLSVSSVTDAIRTHFYPLLEPEFTQVLSTIYPRGVAITVNGERVMLPKMKRETSKYFVVRHGRRHKLLGIGFLLRTADELAEEHRGLAISTYGKVIKRGWDWLGITPKNPNHLTGVIELPALVECLTTNKSEFMRDTNSLPKYYKYRKAIQEAVSDVLEGLGETRAAQPKDDRSLEKLEKEIKEVVGEILPDFPELAPLFGRKEKGDQATALVPESEGTVSASESDGTDVASGAKGGAGSGEGMEGAIGGPLDGTHLEPTDRQAEHATERTTHRRRPGLMIAFDEDTGGDEIAWLRGNTVLINALHPGYKRVKKNGDADLYITFAVATTLGTQVGQSRSPVQFVERFISVWGKMK